eukprot:474493_1
MADIKNNLINLFVKLFKIYHTFVKQSRLIKSATIVLFLYFLRQLICYIYRKYHHLPPGPNGYPLIGSSLQMLYTPQWQVKMVQQYGAIFCFHFAVVPMVFISDSSIIKQLFSHKDYLNRVDELYYPLYLQSVGHNSTLPLISINGETWIRRRKHVQNTLFRSMTHEYVGLALQQAINKELEPLLKNLMVQNQLWFPRELCQYLAFNTLFHTMFGKQIERNSKLYNEMITDLENTFKLMPQDLFIRFYPWIRHVSSIFEQIKLTRNRRNNNVSKLIQQRFENMKNESKNLKETYIDCTHQLVLDGQMTKDEMIADAYFLLAAGTDTTASTLTIGIVVTAKHVSVQQQIRTELLSAMNNGVFDLKMVNKCPLFRAYIYEILRISSVSYQGVSHISFKDYWITVNGNKYKIPKHTMVLTNVDYIHIHNKNNEHWKHVDGDKIHLDNFLSDDKTKFVMNESFVGFGVGRRDCVGRMVAMKEIQYILAYLLMNYKISLDKPIDDVIKYRKPNLSTVCMSPVVGVKMQKL